MLLAHNHPSSPPSSSPSSPLVPAVSGSLLAVGLPNVLKSTEVETSANRLWSPNGLYLFMQALASPQDSVALTQEDSGTSKNDPSLGSLSSLCQWVDKCSCQCKVLLASVENEKMNCKTGLSQGLACWRSNTKSFGWHTVRKGRKSQWEWHFDIRSGHYHLTALALWGLSTCVGCGWRWVSYELILCLTYLDSPKQTCFVCAFPVSTLKTVQLCLRQFQREKLFFKGRNLLWCSRGSR